MGKSKINENVGMQHDMLVSGFENHLAVLKYNRLF